MFFWRSDNGLRRLFQPGLENKEIGLLAAVHKRREKKGHFVGKGGREDDGVE